MDTQPSAARALAPEDEQDLVREIAGPLIGGLSPDELDLFDETADEYFADPEAVLAADRRDEAVGFGLELAMLTPVVLAVVTAVVQFLASTLSDAAKDVTKPALVRMLRKVFRVDAATDTPMPPLSSVQVERVRQIALDNGRTLGLPENTARLLADSIAGGIAIPS